MSWEGDISDVEAMANLAFVPLLSFFLVVLLV